MKKFLFALYLIAVWALGIYEDDCTFAVGVSLIAVIALTDKLFERSRCVKKICRWHIFREDRSDSSDYEKKTDKVFN